MDPRFPLHATHQLPGEGFHAALGHRLRRSSCCWTFEELRLGMKMPEGPRETLEEPWE